MRRPHQKLVRRGAAEGGPEGTTHHSPPPHLPSAVFHLSPLELMPELEYPLRVEVAKRDQPRDMCSFFSKKKKGAPSDSTWPSSRDAKPRSTFDDPPDFRIFVSKGSV